MDSDKALSLIASLRAGDYACVTEAWPGPQLPYLPWYVADFNGNGMVAAMTDRQELWYRRLLERSWQMTCPCFLPNDPVFLANICRCNPLDFQGDGSVVIDRFQRTPDGKYLFHSRMLREYLEMSRRYEAQSSAGRETAKKKREKKLAESLAKVQASSQALNNQNQNQNHIKEEPPPTPSKPDRSELNPIEVSIIICRELGFAGTSIRLLIEEQIENELRRVPGMTSEDAGNAMVAQWGLYQKSSEFKSQYRKSPKTFFSTPSWKDEPEVWERANGSKNKAEQRRDDNLRAYHEAIEILDAVDSPTTDNPS